jgi:hypothetical protein
MAQQTVPGSGPAEQPPDDGLGADAAGLNRVVVVRLLCLGALAVLALAAVWYFATSAGAAGGCGGG